MLLRGIINDPELYLNSIPDSYIKNKQNIIQALREEASKNGGAEAV